MVTFLKNKIIDGKLKIYLELLLSDKDVEVYLIILINRAKAA